MIEKRDDAETILKKIVEHYQAGLTTPEEFTDAIFGLAMNDARTIIYSASFDKHPEKTRMTYGTVHIVDTHLGGKDYDIAIIIQTLSGESIRVDQGNLRNLKIALEIAIETLQKRHPREKL